MGDWVGFWAGVSLRFSLGNAMGLDVGSGLKQQQNIWQFLGNLQTYSCGDCGNTLLHSSELKNKKKI